MAPAWSRRNPLPLVVILTLALVGSMAVAGTLLVAALDVLYTDQLKANFSKDAQRRADYLEETFSRMLWNFATDELQAVGGAVVRDEVVLALTVRTDDGIVVFRQAKEGAQLLSISRTLRFEGTKVGDFTLVLSADTLNHQRAALTGASVGAVLGLLVLLSLAAPYLLNRTVLRPFSRLSRALQKKPESGPFPDLPDPSSPIRELRTLEVALSLLNKAVASQVDELETRVEARTKQLREAQERLVRTETLATLGQLAAGIAHELNTPLGAILSSTQHLQNKLTQDLIPLSAKGMNLPSAVDPLELLRDAARLSSAMDTFPRTSERRALAKRWQEMGGKPDTALFDLVTTTGLSSRLDDLAAWAKDPSVEESVQRVAEWSRSLAIVLLATEKAAAVVSALRAQVQSGETRVARPLELRKELEQALALLQNKVKHGIKVNLSSEREVWVQGDPNELGKVWLNLMLNAVQAMDGAGTLGIALSVREGMAVVEFQDDGPGIPEAVLPRIFEPFFTTKPTGMGLGLEITKRIVEEHRGTIVAESAPGRTVFRVSLPAWTGQTPASSPPAEDGPSAP